MMPAALSIVIPIYNAAATLQRTLTSLDRIPPERRPSVQVLLINDGSSDKSLDVARSHAATHPEWQWVILDQPNAGVSAARNAGLDRAAGEWLFFLDSDDELGCDPFPLLERGQGASCVLAAVEYVGPGPRHQRNAPPAITRENRADIFTAASPIAISSLFFRKDRVRHAFDADIRYTEDWLFWNRNHEIFDHPLIVPEATASIVHIHASNASANYQGWGRDRAIVAGRIRELFDASLTRKQKNNLAVQQQIGLLQQRRWIAPSAFVRWPCSLTLYLKLWVYAASALLGLRASAYQPAQSQTKT